MIVIYQTGAVSVFTEVERIHVVEGLATLSMPDGEIVSIPLTETLDATAEIFNALHGTAHAWQTRPINLVPFCAECVKDA